MFPIKRSAPSAQDRQKTHSAGVHNTGLLECRQHVRRLVKNGFAALDHLVKKTADVLGMTAGIPACILSDYADNGQNRALFWLHNRLIRRICAALQACSECCCINRLFSVNSLGKPTKNLR